MYLKYVCGICVVMVCRMLESRSKCSRTLSHPSFVILLPVYSEFQDAEMEILYIIIISQLFWGHDPLHGLYIDLM